MEQSVFTCAWTSFRRTFVGLKQEIGEWYGEGNPFQTNLRGVEAERQYNCYLPVAVFQTNLRGVEAR